ncbi:MAG: choice-of-anchor V domain-containing protein [Bryobacterales bacterium]
MGRNTRGNAIGVARCFGAALSAAALLIALGPLMPRAAIGGQEGLPVAHTGFNGEPTCSEAGCHRNTLGGEASVFVEVGPYVPGAEAQPVIVTIDDPAATRWGFQLAARRADNLSLPAGTFEAINNFTRVRCADGEAPPCDAAEMQYATHTSSGTASGPRYTLNWTAPAEDVGDVVFTVAALGADGDMGTNGDRVASATAASLYAPSNTPTISAVVSAAAYDAAGAGIAPGSLITIFGENLAAPDVTRNVMQSDFDAQSRLPVELNRLAVEFTTTSDPIPERGRIIYVQPDQVNLQAPDFEIPAGAGVDEMVRVEVLINPDRGENEIRSTVLEFPVRRISPALFTLDSSGQGDVAAVHADGRIVAATDAYPGSFPAAPNEVILIYGNGFGATDPSFEAGQLATDPAPLLLQPTAFEIGGLMADIAYAGAAPGYAGLYQFNITVPDLPPGEHAVVVRTEMLATQTGVTIQVE